MTVRRDAAMVQAGQGPGSISIKISDQAAAAESGCSTRVSMVVRNIGGLSAWACL